MAWPLVAMAAAQALKTGGDVVGGKKAQSAAQRKEDEARRRLDAFGGQYAGFQEMLAKAFGIDPKTGAMSSGGLAALAAGPQTQTTTSEQVINQLVAPEIAKEMAGGEELAYSKLLQNVQRGSALPPGFAETQAANINLGAAPALQAERNVAARHGLTGDAARLGSAADRTRVADINTMRMGVEGEERRRKQEDLASLVGYVTGRRGQRTKGRTSGTSTTTGPGNIGDVLGIYGALAPREPTVFT